MTVKLLATLGPSSLNKETVQGLEINGVDLFRINLSHTLLKDMESTIEKIQSWTNIPMP